MPSAENRLRELQRYSQFAEITGTQTYIEEASNELSPWFWRKAIRMGVLTLAFNTGRSVGDDHIQVTASGVTYSGASKRLLQLFALKLDEDHHNLTIPMIGGAVSGEPDPVALTIEKALALQLFDPLEAVLLAQDLSEVYSNWLIEVERVVAATLEVGWFAIDGPKADRLHRDLEGKFNELAAPHWSKILDSVRSRISG